MLSNITWTQFFISLVFFMAIYYLFTIFFYYQEDINRWILKGKNKDEASLALSVPSSDTSTFSSAQTERYSAPAQSTEEEIAKQNAGTEDPPKKGHDREHMRALHLEFTEIITNAEQMQREFIHEGSISKEQRDNHNPHELDIGKLNSDEFNTLLDSL